MGDRAGPCQSKVGQKVKVSGCCAPFRGGDLGPHVTQCGLDRGLPVYQVASSSIQPFGHNTPTSQTGENGPIASGEPFDKRTPIKGDEERPTSAYAETGSINMAETAQTNSQYPTSYSTLIQYVDVSTTHWSLKTTSVLVGFLGDRLYKKPSYR